MTISQDSIADGDELRVKMGSLHIPNPHPKLAQEVTGHAGGSRRSLDNLSTFGIYTVAIEPTTNRKDTNVKNERYFRTLRFF
jgi:hypothetical protein